MTTPLTRIHESRRGQQRPLGRHLQHDPRSRAYAYNTSKLTVSPVKHERRIPTFDQADTSSCTGMAAVGCIGSDPIWSQLTNPPALDQWYAEQIYSEATKLDEDPEQFPPTDCGSTGLAAAKALQQQCLITGYQHTFSIDDMLKALAVTPVMLGINWYDSFDEPAASGLIAIGKHAEVRGGHEVYADEIREVGGKIYIGIANSWGTSWGDMGRGYLNVSTTERLLHEDGDVIVPIPWTTTTPPASSEATPTTPDDVELWAAMQRWAKAKNVA